MNNLPDGYKEIKRINLEKDKKLFIIMNVLVAIVFFIMINIGVMFNPINFTIDKKFLLLFILTMILFIIYIIAHETTHGYFIKKFSGIKPHYGFAGLCAYAGSNAYFSKKHYIIIALSPIVILGIILAIINLIVPQHYFWLVYLIQMGNISGSVGDFYATYLMCKMPSDTLTQDTGVSIVMYSKQ